MTFCTRNSYFLSLKTIAISQCWKRADFDCDSIENRIKCIPDNARVHSILVSHRQQNVLSTWIDSETYFLYRGTSTTRCIVVSFESHDQIFRQRTQKKTNEKIELENRITQMLHIENGKWEKCILFCYVISWRMRFKSKIMFFVQFSNFLFPFFFVVVLIKEIAPVEIAQSNCVNIGFFKQFPHFNKTIQLPKQKFLHFIRNSFFFLSFSLSRCFVNSHCCYLYLANGWKSSKCNVRKMKIDLQHQIHFHLLCSWHWCSTAFVFYRNAERKRLSKQATK